MRLRRRSSGPSQNKAASENRKDPGTAIQEFLIAGRRSPNVRSLPMFLEPEFQDKQTSPRRIGNMIQLRFGNRKSLSMHAPIKFQFAGDRDRDGVPIGVQDFPQAQIRAIATRTIVGTEDVPGGRCPMSQKRAASSRGAGQFLFVRETAVRAGNVSSARCTTVHVDSTALRAPRRTDGDLGPRAPAADGEGWVCDRGCHLVTRPRDSHCSWLFSKACFKCREISARLNRSPLDKASSNLRAYLRKETEATRVLARCAEGGLREGLSIPILSP